MIIQIPFMKLHGAENDFLLTWEKDLPDCNLNQVAVKICARMTGIGADGWMLVSIDDGRLRTRLFNSDGSEPEISGNGTRCAAAFGFYKDVLTDTHFVITTAAGPKPLRLIVRSGLKFLFEMNMGEPQVQQLRSQILLDGTTYDTSILDVGNPQCAIFVDDFPENWRSAAAEAEGHSRFPKRSNVSFVRVMDRHTISVLFYERGAGETRSSGTGATGAGTAAILRKVVESPLEILTPAGSLNLRWDESVFLTGPAEVIGEGTFLIDLGNS